MREEEGQQQVNEAYKDNVDPHRAFSSANRLILIIQKSGICFLTSAQVLIPDTQVFSRPDLSVVELGFSYDLLYFFLVFWLILV
jgi:hypothetical protein